MAQINASDKAVPRVVDPDSKEFGGRKVLFVSSSPSGEFIAVGYTRCDAQRIMPILHASSLLSFSNSTTSIFQVVTVESKASGFDFRLFREIKQPKPRSCCFLGEQKIAIGFDDGKIRIWFLQAGTNQPRARILCGQFKLSCTCETRNMVPVRCLSMLPTTASANLLQNSAHAIFLASGSEDGKATLHSNSSTNFLVLNIFCYQELSVFGPFGAAVQLRLVIKMRKSRPASR